MANEMTAAEIIALLRERPGCCELIELRLAEDGSRAFSTEFNELWADDNAHCAMGFRRWLTGACVEKCEELGIDVVRANSSGSEWYFGPRNRCIESDVQLYPTFLHAATAAIEAHCKETP